VVTGLLGAAFTASTQLTGFGTEEAFFLSVMGTNVDMRGLLLAASSSVPSVCWTT
jgi:uncharacterized membrane protein